MGEKIAVTRSGSGIRSIVKVKQTVSLPARNACVSDANVLPLSAFSGTVAQRKQEKHVPFAGNRITSVPTGALWRAFESHLV